MSRSVADWLPGTGEWMADAELNGHTLAETVAWAALSMDLADDVQRRSYEHAVVVSPAGLPGRWRRRVRA